VTVRLGHIVYSNCFPVHAGILDAPPGWIRIRCGVPTELNEALAAGAIDVAPSSSIEYARHEEYRIIPGPAIASDGPVRSIVLELAGRGGPETVHGRTVALPTASATSVVLLRALLERRHGVVPAYAWFDQGAEDPLAGGAAGALWIGDAALRRARREDRSYLDLGEAWRDWTGLPFVYAVWQTRLQADRDGDLRRLARALEASRAYFLDRVDALAEREAAPFGLPADELRSYWASLRYTLDASAMTGLTRFYELAAVLGEASVPDLRFTPVP